MWRVLLNKVPTKDNLAYKGVDISSTSCELYKKTKDNAMHLFYGFPISKSIWDQYDKFKLSAS